MGHLSFMETIIPEAAGIHSRGLLDFIRSIREKQINVHSFMLLRYGKIVAEAYFKPFDANLLHPVFSVSKSFTSAAVGIAIGEGLLSLDDRVADFFPEILGDQKVHPYTAMMTVRHLLAMATVHSRSTDTSGGEWVKSFLTTEPSHIPGTSFAYDTTGTHTLCAIIQKQAGMTVHEYLKTRLLEPLGIGEIEWDSCPMNINKGGSGIKCTTMDLARFGQLYLQKGLWEQKRILPAGWVELSTKRHFDNSNARMALDGNQGYAYQFWLTRNNTYCAFGMGGQLVVVMPDKEAVFVSTANTLKYKDGQQLILDSLWETLYPAISDKPITGGEAARLQLKETLKHLELVLPKGNPSSPVSDRISGKRLKLDANPMAYDACQFDFTEGRSGLCLYKGNDKVAVSFKMNGWTTGTDPFCGMKAANGATWVDENTLILHIQLFDALQMFILTCRFEKAGMAVHILPVGVMDCERLEGYLNALL